MSASSATASPLDALLSEMTVEEKAMQLSAVYPMGLLGPHGPLPGELEAQLGQGIGHISGIGLMGYKEPETIAQIINAIHVSRDILTTLLRERMGFAGTVVSDYVGVGWAQTRQRVAATAEEVGALALAAGMDVELPTVHGYGRGLVEAVASGKIAESVLDRSVRRVLEQKLALRLFDDPAPVAEGRATASLTAHVVTVTGLRASSAQTIVRSSSWRPATEHGVQRFALAVLTHLSRVAGDSAPLVGPHFRWRRAAG